MTSRPRWAHVISVLGAVATVGLAWWLFPTDARRVRAACHELAASLSAPPRESEVARLARLAQLARHLAPEVSVEAEGLDTRIEGRDQAVTLAGRLDPTPAGRTVTLEDLHVAIGEDRRSADVDTVVVVGEPDASGGPDNVERRQVTMVWAKTQDGWRLARAVVLIPD